MACTQSAYVVCAAAFLGVVVDSSGSCDCATVKLVSDYVRSKVAIYYYDHHRYYDHDRYYVIFLTCRITWYQTLNILWFFVM